MKKLLVTGASGYLGSFVLDAQPADWEVIPCFYKNRDSIPKEYRKKAVDLHENLSTIFDKVQPNAVLHLAAISKIGQCKTQPDLSQKVNIELTKNLVSLAKKHYIPFLFTSSEQVFDGLKAPYQESAPPTPKTIYAEHKTEAENHVLNYEKGIVARMPVMFGKSKNGCPNYFEEWINKWQNGEEVTVFHDEIRSFLFTPIAAKLLFLLLEKGENEIYHIGSSEGWSRERFAQEMWDQIYTTKDRKLIKSFSQNEVNTGYFRPPNLTLSTDKIEAFGFNIPSLKEQIKKAIEE